MAEKKSFLLRIDADVLEGVRRWADADLRSLNGQIEFLLRAALRQTGRLPSQPSSDAASGEDLRDSGKSPEDPKTKA